MPAKGILSLASLIWLIKTLLPVKTTQTSPSNKNCICKHSVPSRLVDLRTRKSASHLAERGNAGFDALPGLPGGGQCGRRAGHHGPAEERVRGRREQGDLLRPGLRRGPDLPVVL